MLHVGVVFDAVAGLEDFTLKGVDNDKLHLVGGEIDDENNFLTAFQHGEVRLGAVEKRCRQIKCGLGLGGRGGVGGFGNQGIACWVFCNQILTDFDASGKEICQY